MAVAEQSISLKTRRKTEVRIILGWHIIINFLCRIVNKTDKKQTSDFLISAMRFENISL